MERAKIRLIVVVLAIVAVGVAVVLLFKSPEEAPPPPPAPIPSDIREIGQAAPDRESAGIRPEAETTARSGDAPASPTLALSDASTSPAVREEDIASGDAAPAADAPAADAPAALSLSRGLTKWLTRGPATHKLTGRVVVRSDIPGFNPAQVDLVSLTVKTDTWRSWFAGSKAASEEYRTASLQPDGRLAIPGELKGPATLTVHYNQTPSSASPFRAVLLQHQFVMNTKRRNQDVGDLAVPIKGAIILKLDFPEPPKVSYFEQALALLNPQTKDVVWSAPIFGGQAEEFIPGAPYGEFLARVYSMTYQFEPEFAEVSVVEGAAPPVIEFTALSTGCLRGSVVMKEPDDEYAWQALSPRRVVLQWPDGLERELTPTPWAEWDKLGRDSLYESSYAFQGLPEGDYTVTVEVEGFVSQSKSTHVDKGRIQWLTFVLPKP